LGCGSGGDGGGGVGPHEAPVKEIARHQYRKHLSQFIQHPMNQSEE
jgi:hypothetical protein